MLPAIANPVLTKEDVTDRKAAYVADPFMIKVGDLWYMFFEVRNEGSYLTELAYATSVNGLKWTYQKILPADYFFQSYPYIFEWEGNYYMIPEFYQLKSIKIYRADNFPEGWTPCFVVAEGKKYVDPTIFRHKGKWWVFASTTQNEDLYLFYSDDLKGPWWEHPLSPVVKKDKSSARPGGRVIEYDGNLYRFSQDCSKYYGEKVLAFKINKLTKTEYQEEKAGIALDKGNGWNEKGMHTFDAHAIGEKNWIAAVDGQRQL